MLPTLTVDVGTTSLKFSLFDAEGATLASASRPTPTLADAVGEIYDVEALTGSLRDFIRGLDPEHRALTRRIAITGVEESGGLVREDLSLASPIVLWHDRRGASLLNGLDAEQRRLIYRVTGLPANANYGLSKVAWTLKHAGKGAPGAQWLNVAEFLAATLTGARWSEFSLASRTLALDLTTGGWSAEVAGLLGVPLSAFPPLRRASEGEPLLTRVATTLGLPEDVRVHVAGHDHMVGGVGADLHPGELLNSTGTTEGLLILQDEPSVDEHAERAQLANGISSTGEGFTLFASIPTGGSAFATLQTLLGVDADRLTAITDNLAALHAADRIDLVRIPVVLPQFRGSPPPQKNAAARGIIAGIGTDTTLDEIVYGTFLGMALQFQEVLELFRVRPERIKVIGPASRNSLWLQLKADVLGKPLSVSRFPEVVSRGAQALASGERSDWDSCQPFEVLPSTARNGEFVAWRHQIAPLWERVKGAQA